MANSVKPQTYLGWCPDGSASKVVMPPPSQLASGWTSGEAPPYQFENWVNYTVDQWIQYFDQAINGAVSMLEIGQTMRLVGGGTWGYVQSTGVLSWSSSFALSVPSLPDSQNTIAAGSVTLAAGQVAYVVANLPFATTGTVTSGSTAISNLAYELGIVAGQTVTGTGIPSGTTVTSVTGTTANISAAATSTVSNATLTFASVTTPTVQTAAVQSLVPAPNIIVLARCTGALVILGVNSGQMVLRDQEQKLLLDAGYLSITTATAGQALSASQAVYLSTGADGRTAGSLYPVDASAASGAQRSSFIGFVTSATASGATATIVTDGVLANFSSLTPGALYYADPANVGAITATKPVTTNAYLVPVGVALSAKSIDINPAQAASVQLIQSLNPYPNYGAATEAQFSAALTAANATGGIIVLTASFSLNAVYALAAGVVVQGRKQSSVLTMNTGSALNLQGDGSELRDVFFTTSAAVTCVSVTGSFAIVRGCLFTLATAAASVGVSVAGSATRLYNNVFANVSGMTTTSTGIVYTSTSADCIDDSTYILS